MNNKKIMLGTTRKKTHSTIMTAATTIVPVFASATRILRIQKQRSQQTIERKGIRNKKIYLKSFFIPYYFCVMHYAVLAGLQRFLSGDQKGAWDKAERKLL